MNLGTFDVELLIIARGEEFRANNLYTGDCGSGMIHVQQRCKEKYEGHFKCCVTQRKTELDIVEGAVWRCPQESGYVIGAGNSLRCEKILWSSTFR